MQVKINSVDVEWVPGKNGKYGKAAVKFDQNGKERTQFLVSFKNPEVFKKVQELIGQTVDVEQTKNGDFWEWKSISVSTATSNVATSTAGATATRVSGSNYETKEERAARQVLIVKQSSLANAVATLSPGAKAALDPAAVFDLAQKYTDWVLAQPEDKSGFDTMSDDIPY